MRRNNLIHYKYEKDVPHEKLANLFKSVGWESGQYPNLLHDAIYNSFFVCTAWHEENLIGLINCISDGYLYAYIPFLLVNPEYQSQGIGQLLLQNTISNIKHIQKTILLCDSDKRGFYEKDFFTVYNDAIAMICTKLPKT